MEITRGKAFKILVPEVSGTKKSAIDGSNNRIYFYDSYTQVSKFFKGANNMGQKKVCKIIIKARKDSRNLNK